MPWTRAFQAECRVPRVDGAVDTHSQAAVADSQNSLASLHHIERDEPCSSCNRVDSLEQTVLVWPVPVLRLGTLLRVASSRVMLLNPRGLVEGEKPGIGLSAVGSIISMSPASADVERIGSGERVRVEWGGLGR